MFYIKTPYPIVQKIFNTENIGEEADKSRSIESQNKDFTTVHWYTDVLLAVRPSPHFSATVILGEGGRADNPRYAPWVKTRITFYVQLIKKPFYSSALM